MSLRRYSVRPGCVAAAIACFFALACPSEAASTKIAVPLGLLAGMTPGGAADPHALVHVAIEYAPKADLDMLATEMSDAGTEVHRETLTADAFVQRFGRDRRDGEALTAFLRANGARDVYLSPDSLVGGGVLDVAHAARAFGVQFRTYTAGTRTAIAPAGPLHVPLANVRSVHGTVQVTTPRLDAVPTFTFFRGDWYTPDRFREAYDAAAGGGTGERITIIEDGSDRVDVADIALFARGEGAPAGASADHVTEHSVALKAASSACGRDDRGQEPALDTDAAMTMAPLASIVLQYDDICAPGVDGALALKRALDAAEAPSVLVFPFSIGPTFTSIDASYGKPPIALLEAIVRGIPLVASAGDDGAYGYRIPGIDVASVAYPCASPLVICAGGTQLGERDGVFDEAPWNDNEHATGGGIGTEPRPAWQNAKSSFEFSDAFIKTRIAPDLSADGSGHLRIYWHGYGLGGVGGTSESASLIGGQLAAINSLVPNPNRLGTASDIYALAALTPNAFRDVQRENDRGYIDNTLRPRRPILPKDFRGVIPAAPKAVIGCSLIQVTGCSARSGFDAVAGIGSIREQAAVDALRLAPRRQKTR